MNDEARVCKVCGLPAEDGYAMPLCAACRNHMAERPFPRWIQVVTIALVPCLCLALLQFPHHLAAGIAYERGQKAESQGKYAEAATQYARALERFPNSDEILTRNCVALYRSRRYVEAAVAYQGLEDRKLPQEDVEELNSIGGDLFSKVKHMRPGTEVKR